MKIDSNIQKKAALQICTYNLEKSYLSRQEETKDQSDHGWKTEFPEWDWDNLRKHLSISVTLQPRTRLGLLYMQR